MKFDEIYKPPFHDFFGIGVKTKEGILCFNWKARMSDETRQKIIDILNGDCNQPVKHSVKEDRGMIYINETPVMLIRGWGHLTGCGALNLPSHEAAKIQDDFGEWIVKKLKQEV